MGAKIGMLHLGAMATRRSWTVLVCLLLCTSLVGQVSGAYTRPHSLNTHRPVIGVLTLPEPGCGKYGNQVIATSNARWLQAGGARVVPIFYDSTVEELEYVLSRVSGVFWTGGAVSFNPSLEDPEGSMYLRTTKYMLNYVIQQNEKGNFYPLWGTCLGFERLLQLIAKDDDATIVEKFDAENFPINLQFTKPAWFSRLFRSMSDDLFKEVASPEGHLAFNNHGLGIHPNSFLNNTNLSNLLSILSIDVDRNGKPFVSTVEGKSMPFYGSQWHPEKAPWEWNPKWQIARNDKAIQFSNYLGRFFVNECKYNKNSFKDEVLLEKMLLHNWVSLPSSALRMTDLSIDMPFTEIYCFDSNRPSSKVPIVRKSLRVQFV